jgi:hypothetical protein
MSQPPLSAPQLHDLANAFEKHLPGSEKLVKEMRRVAAKRKTVKTKVEEISTGGAICLAIFLGFIGVPIGTLFVLTLWEAWKWTIGIFKGAVGL